MIGEPKRQNHPLTAYVIGLVVLTITLVVFAGVLYHLGISHHGPQLLKPFIGWFFGEDNSQIMKEAELAKELEIHRHFHHVVDYPSWPEDQQPVCYICHSDYPHSKNKRVRSLLNMHTQYSVCESCHLKKKPGSEILLKWYSPLDEDPKGPFLGTSYDPETGNLIQVKDKFSKITPFFRNGAKLQLAMQQQNAPMARDFMKVRDKLTPEQREGVKNKFHVDIEPKGYECKTCHSEKSILDFKRLGFSEERIVDLKQMNVKGMLTKYEEFYLPELFKEP